MSTDELIWDDEAGPVDLRDARPIAADVMERINGIALLLDPDYRAVKPISISYKKGGAEGAMVFGDWTPNRDTTSLGRHLNQQLFAKDMIVMAQQNHAIRFVLEAIAMPRTWATLYIIYEAIAADVGGVHALKKNEFVGADELDEFTNSANNSRNLTEGARHGKAPHTGRPLIPLVQAYWIVNRLALGWLDWIRADRPNE